MQNVKSLYFILVYHYTLAISLNIGFFWLFIFSHHLILRFVFKYNGCLNYKSFRMSVWFRLLIWIDLSLLLLKHSWTGRGGGPYLYYVWALLSQPSGYSFPILFLQFHHFLIKEKEDFIYFILCVWVVACLHVCMYALCMPSVHGFQKRELDPLVVCELGKELKWVGHLVFWLRGRWEAGAGIAWPQCAGDLVSHCFYQSRWNHYFCQSRWVSLLLNMEFPPMKKR